MWVRVATTAWLATAGWLLGVASAQASEALVLHTKAGAPLGLSVGGKRLNLGGQPAQWRAVLGAPSSTSVMPAGQVAWAYPHRGLRVIVQAQEVRGVGLVLDGQHVSVPPQRGAGKPLPAMLAGYRTARFVTDEGLNPQSTVAQVRAAMGATNFEDFAHAERMRQLHFTRPHQNQPTGARVLFRYVQQKLVEVVLTRW